MALIKINRNNTAYEMYHVPTNRVEAERQALLSLGLGFSDGMTEPSADSFTILYREEGVAPLSHRLYVRESAA